MVKLNIYECIHAISTFLLSLSCPHCSIVDFNCSGLNIVFRKITQQYSRISETWKQLIMHANEPKQPHCQEYQWFQPLINRINILTCFLGYNLKAARHRRIMNEILPNVSLHIIQSISDFKIEIMLFLLKTSWKGYPITSFLRWCVSPCRVEFEWLVSK